MRMLQGIQLPDLWQAEGRMLSTRGDAKPHEGDDLVPLMATRQRFGILPNQRFWARSDLPRLVRVSVTALSLVLGVVVGLLTARVGLAPLAWLTSGVACLLMLGVMEKILRGVILLRRRRLAAKIARGEIDGVPEADRLGESRDRPLPRR